MVGELDRNEINPTPSSKGMAPGFIKYPDYDLKLRPSSSLHHVIFNEAVIAASSKAIIVHEQGLCAVAYFPRVDVDMTLLGAEETTSYCPFKGTASYWSVSANGRDCDRAAWSYDNPFDEVSPLSDHIAFYMDKMDCHWRNGVELPLVGPGRCASGDCNELRAA